MKRHESPGPTLLGRVFSLLLHLLPPVFRRRFAREMTEAFEESLRDSRSLLGRLTLFARAVGELLTALLPEWLARLRDGSGPPSHPDRNRAAAPPVGGLGFGSLFQDLRYGLRALRKRPLHTGAAVSALGLGIGAATALFSVAEGVLLRPPPYRDPEQVVEVWQVFPHWKDREGLSHMWQNLGISYPQFMDWRRDQTSFESVAAFYTSSELTMAWTGDGPARPLSIGVASATLLPTLGIEPVLGRGFLSEEEAPEGQQSERVALVSWEFWAGHLGSDPNVVGRDLTLDGHPFVVIGVLPAGFRFRSMGRWTDQDIEGAQDVWILPGAGPVTTSRSSNIYDAIGRLRSGTTLEAAVADIQTSMFQGAPPSERTARVVPRTAEELGGLASPIFLLLGAAGLLFLIGCVNAGILSLSELNARGLELSTRWALGAGRFRISRQLLTESALIGCVGSLLGVVVAWGGTKALISLAPPLPRLHQVGVDSWVLAFAIGLGLLSGILFGTMPALVSTRSRASLLTIRNRVGADTSGMRLQRLLLSLQMALTVSLLVSGGLMTRSLYAIRSVDPGFQARGLSTARISIPNHLLEVSAPASQPPDEAAEETRRAEARIRILGMILDRLAALPGVEDATSADVLPFPGDRVSSTTVAIAGGDGQELRLDPDRFRVWPGFHEAMGIPLLAGRTFASADQGDGGRVAVISESFARRYWPDESALGKKIDDFEGDPLTVVGIVGDVKVGDLSIDVRPTYYLSFGQSSWSKVSLVVRSAEGTGALSEQIRQAIHNVNPSILVLEEGRLSAMVAWSAREDEYRALLMGVFAILATVLAAVGIYGVTARGVSRRSRELSVRIAVGADRTRLVSRTVVESMGASLSGIAVGLLTAFWASQLLERFLFGVRVTDLWTYGVVTVFAVLMSGSASLLPAMGITRIDPARVLKEE